MPFSLIHEYTRERASFIDAVTAMAVVKVLATANVTWGFAQIETQRGDTQTRMHISYNVQ